MARWLLGNNQWMFPLSSLIIGCFPFDIGLKQDNASAQKTFRMLNAFILHKGDLLQSGRLSKAEMSWLRLAAGCAMLKVSSRLLRFAPYGNLYY